MTRILRAVAVLAAGFGLFHGAVAIAFADRTIAAFAAIHVVLAVIPLVAMWLVRRGRVDQSIDIVVVGILATSLAWILAMPGLHAIAVLGPTLAIAYALPFRRGRAVIRIVAAALLTSVLIALIDAQTGHVLGESTSSGSAYLDALHTPTLILGMTLVVLMLWWFSIRLRDLADRATAAADLLRTRELAVAATSCGVTIHDARREGWPIIFVNPAYERITGYTAEEVVGTDGRMIVGAETDPVTSDRIRDTMQSGGGVTARVLNYRKNGSVFWNEVTVSPIVDEQGTVTHAVAIQTDVTAAVTLEQQLRESQRMETVGQLAGGIAHDFNNLLTAIGGYAAVARAEVSGLDADRGLAESLGENLDEIGRATDRAAALTRQLLAFGRRQVVQPRLLSLDAVVHDVLPMLRTLVGEQHRVEVRLAGGLPAVLADPGQLEQVMVNLAVNARDALPDGGRIVIETAGLDGPPRSVRLSVSDDGCGIAPEVQARMFEPFYTTKPRGQGNGLGLSTVYGIVTQSKGVIRCHSVEGAGTTFEIDLPVAERSTGDRVEAEVAAGNGTGVSVPGGNETILVAEDEPAVRTLACAILSRAGYRVLEAERGAQALELARRDIHGIDLLVSDVVMPGMTGPALADRVTALAPTPVLFMSGYPDDELEPSARHPRLLQKPFRAEDLLRAVREALDAAAPGIERDPAISATVAR
jgi:PAS domain S-box-containing protein